MKRKEKAAPDDCSIESGAGEQIRRPAINLPGEEYSTKKFVIQANEPFNLASAEKVTPMRMAEKLIDLGMRDLRTQKGRERKPSVPPLAKGDGGFFLPSKGEKSRDKRRRFLFTMSRQTINTWRATFPACKSAKKLEKEGENNA